MVTGTGRRIAGPWRAAVWLCRFRRRGEPLGHKGGKCWVQLDAGEAAAELPRGNSGGAGAAERVQHVAAWLAPCGNAAKRDVDGERGEMRPTVGTGGDRPHVAGMRPSGCPR